MSVSSQVDYSPEKPRGGEVQGALVNSDLRE